MTLPSKTTVAPGQGAMVLATTSNQEAEENAHQDDAPVHDEPAVVLDKLDVSVLKVQGDSDSDAKPDSDARSSSSSSTACSYDSKEVSSGSDEATLRGDDTDDSGESSESSREDDTRDELPRKPRNKSANVVRGRPARAPTNRASTAGNSLRGAVERNKKKEQSLVGPVKQADVSRRIRNVGETGGKGGVKKGARKTGGGLQKDSSSSRKAARVRENMFSG